jgi:hypothetical protein
VLYSVFGSNTVVAGMSYFPVCQENCKEMLLVKSLSVLFVVQNSILFFFAQKMDITKL